MFFDDCTNNIPPSTYPAGDCCLNEISTPFPVIQGVATYKVDKKGQRLVFKKGHVIYLKEKLNIKNNKKVDVEYNNKCLKIYYI